jgi:hypothetical protein
MQFWDLFQWWNLIFTLPFGIGLLPLLLQAVGAVHFSHGVAHLPHVGGSHVPHHVAVHSHAPSSTPAAHAPAGAPATAGTHAHADAQQTPARVLTILGIGKAPIMLIFTIFCLIWGATGVAGNQVFSMILRFPSLSVWPSMLCAFLVAYSTTGVLSRWISRLMPDTETYGTDEQLLVGRTAQAAYELNAKTGSAFLLDDQQNRIQVRCRTHDGSTIPRGAEVLLLEYDAKSRIFTVVRFQRDTPPAGVPQEQPERPVKLHQKMRLQ